jgi:hypothetical protein
VVSAERGNEPSARRFVEVAEVQALEHAQPEIGRADARVFVRRSAAMSALAASNIPQAVFSRSVAERPAHNARNAASSTRVVSLMT